MDHESMLYFLIFFFINFINGNTDKSTAGPYDVVIQGIQRCQRYENDEFQFKYKLKKLNRTALAVDSVLWMPSSVGPTDKLKFSMDQLANNKWKQNFYHIELELCTALDIFVPTLAAQIYKTHGVDHCFVKPGNYSSKNFMLVVKFKTVPVFFYNKYRVGIEIFSKTGTRKFCLIVFADVVPKRRKSV